VRGLTVALTLVLVTSGCAVAPSTPVEVPLLHLAPAALGQTVNLVQRLTIKKLPDAARATTGASEHSLDALLQIDQSNLRLAAFALGQRVLTLSWDGHHLDSTRHPLLPVAVGSEAVLRDIQLVYWPLASIRESLPAHWTLDEVGATRTLSFDQVPEVVVSYSATPAWTGRAELDNRAEGYRLEIESAVQDGA
jgi:hypothetical protein